MGRRTPRWGWFDLLSSVDATFSYCVSFNSLAVIWCSVSGGTDARRPVEDSKIDDSEQAGKRAGRRADGIFAVGSNAAWLANSFPIFRRSRRCCVGM